jgi:hypothetical protein
LVALDGYGSPVAPVWPDGHAGVADGADGAQPPRGPVGNRGLRIAISCAFWTVSSSPATREHCTECFVLM